MPWERKAFHYCGLKGRESFQSHTLPNLVLATFQAATFCHPSTPPGPLGRMGSATGVESFRSKHRHRDDSVPNHAMIVLWQTSR
jgi:hypothetical protein